MVRGAADRESFKTTKNILVSGKKKLVLFPEGELSYTRMKLYCRWKMVPANCHSGRLMNCKRAASSEPVYVLPVALKYTYRKNITHQLDWAITKLEKRLSINGHSEESLYLRVRAAASSGCWKRSRSQYNCKVTPETLLNDRLAQVKEHAMRSMAELIGVEAWRP